MYNRESQEREEFVGQTDRQTDTDRQRDWQKGRKTDRRADILTSKETGRRADRQTDMQTDRQTNKQPDILTGRQAEDRQTDRQTDREGDMSVNTKFLCLPNTIRLDCVLYFRGKKRNKQDRTAHYQLAFALFSSRDFSCYSYRTLIKKEQQKNCF